MLHNLHQAPPTPAANSWGFFRCTDCHNETKAVAERSPRSVRNFSLPFLPAPYSSPLLRNPAFRLIPLESLSFSDFQSPHLLLLALFSLSLSSREFCFYLLTAAFAIQVHESAFHRIRHDNDLRRFRFSFWLQPPLAFFHTSRLFPVRNFLVVPKPFPHPFLVSWSCNLSASSFSLWHLHKSFSFLTNSKASSVLWCSVSFMFSMIWSCNLSLALLCTLSLPSIAFLSDSLMSSWSPTQQS